MCHMYPRIHTVVTTVLAGDFSARRAGLAVSAAARLPGYHGREDFGLGERCCRCSQAAGQEDSQQPEAATAEGGQRKGPIDQGPVGTGCSS